MLDRVREGANYDAQQIKILSEALNQALLLAAIPDRKDERATQMAKRVIDVFEAGERDPMLIAQLLAGH